MLERVPKYTLRKLSVGLASVMIGSGILMNSPKVLADTFNSNKGTSTAVKSSSQIEDKSGKSVTEAATTTVNNKESENELKLTKASAGAPASATTTNAEEKVWQQIPEILRKIKVSRQMRMKLRKILPMSAKKVLK